MKRLLDHPLRLRHGDTEDGLFYHRGTEHTERGIGELSWMCNWAGGFGAKVKS